MNDDNKAIAFRSKLTNLILNFLLWFINTRLWWLNCLDVWSSSNQLFFYILFRFFVSQRVTTELVRFWFRLSWRWLHDPWRPLLRPLPRPLLRSAHIDRHASIAPTGSGQRIRWRQTNCSSWEWWPASNVTRCNRWRTMMLIVPLRVG